MISEEEKAIIKRIAKKYNVVKIFLFGSSISPQREARDIDLAVEGITPRDFFKFYGELFGNLSRPVDLVDLSDKSLFTELIREDGVILYG